MVYQFKVKIINWIKIILFKSKKQKVGFSQEKYKRFDKINSIYTYSNKKLIKFIFERAVKARSLNLYEQDGVISQQSNPNIFLVKFLLYDYISKINFKKKIKILDYGGSFGNTFFSIEKDLNLKFDWYVCDQNVKINLARKCKIFKPVSFIKKKEIKKNYFYDIIFFSSSLQYFYDPINTLKELKKSSKIILVNNIPLTSSVNSYLRVETPDPSIYNFKYPCWFLSKLNLKNNLKKNYNTVFIKSDNIYELSKSESYYNLILKAK